MEHKLGIRRMLIWGFAMLFAAGTFFVAPTSVQAAKKVTLNKNAIVLNVGKTFQLKVKNAKGAKITYKSLKTSIASVSKKGKIKAKKKGIAKIVVKVKMKKKTYKKICRVTVLNGKKAAQSVSQKPTATVVPTKAPETTVSSAPTATTEPTLEPEDKTFAPALKTALENNPLLTNSYTADPAVIEYNGRIYVYMTNDSQHYEKGNHTESNTYGYIQSMHIISTDDMVNWEDHGTVQIAAANAVDKKGVCKWAGCCWAPCAVTKKINGQDKFFVYFTNGGYQIGVVEADSPTGPFTDPIGKALVGPFSDNETTTGALDPSVFTDDDGTSYLCYGNGALKASGKDGARIRKLGEDMTSFVGEETTIDAPYFFEDSGINKINGKYYFSYCSDWNERSTEYKDLGLCSIAYMTASSPEGPYEYQGDILKNCGEVFGVYGNNHHSMIQYQQKWYMFYHTRVLETLLGSDLGFRSVHVNELTINADGSIVPVQQDMAGVSQIKSFDPYQSTSGTVFADCSGMQSTRYLEDGAYMEAVSNPENYQYAWSLVKGVDFGVETPKSFTATFKMDENTKASFKVYADKLGGDVIAEASIVPNEDDTVTITVPVNQITGKHNLYFAFDGAVHSFEAWSFGKE